MGSVRPPAVAGLFYPDDPATLRAVLQDLLEAAHGERSAPPGAAPKALIAPHAGYVYSGPVAARAYRTLESAAEQISRVILIGPAHFVPTHGLALPASEAFETPLGRVPVDHEAVLALRDLPTVAVAEAPHRREHALEVQLPFLQTVLEAFTLLPLLVGAATPAEVAAVLERVWGGAETLIIVSSDLSHYHDHETARRLDAATAAVIERGDAGGLGPDDACGHLAIAGLLAAAGRHGLSVRRLDLRSSGDTAGPKDRVVGYGAWSLHRAAGAPPESGVRR